MAMLNNQMVIHCNLGADPVSEKSITGWCFFVQSKFYLLFIADYEHSGNLSTN